jgi:hypothetical protein
MELLDATVHAVDDVDLLDNQNAFPKVNLQPGIPLWH